MVQSSRLRPRSPSPKRRGGLRPRSPSPKRRGVRADSGQRNCVLFRAARNCVVVGRMRDFKKCKTFMGPKTGTIACSPKRAGQPLFFCPDSCSSGLCASSDCIPILLFRPLKKIRRAGWASKDVRFFTKVSLFFECLPCPSPMNVLERKCVGGSILSRTHSLQHIVGDGSEQRDCAPNPLENANCAPNTSQNAFKRSLQRVPVCASGRAPVPCRFCICRKPLCPKAFLHASCFVHAFEFA